MDICPPYAVSTILLLSPNRRMTITVLPDHFNQRLFYRKVPKRLGSGRCAQEAEAMSRRLLFASFITLIFLA